MIRNSLLGVVVLCASDFLALRKNVSGVQILSTMRLFKGNISMGPWKANLSSTHIWRKNISIVYSCGREGFLPVNHVLFLYLRPTWIHMADISVNRHLQDCESSANRKITSTFCKWRYFLTILTSDTGPKLVTNMSVLTSVMETGKLIHAKVIMIQQNT